MRPLEQDFYRHKHHFWDTTLEVISLLLIVILRQSENSPYKNAESNVLFVILPNLLVSWI